MQICTWHSQWLTPCYTPWHIAMTQSLLYFPTHYCDTLHVTLPDTVLWHTLWHTAVIQLCFNTILETLSRRSLWHSQTHCYDTAYGTLPTHGNDVVNDTLLDTLLWQSRWHTPRYTAMTLSMTHFPPHCYGTIHDTLLYHSQWQSPRSDTFHDTLLWQRLWYIPRHTVMTQSMTHCTSHYCDTAYNTFPDIMLRHRLWYTPRHTATIHVVDDALPDTLMCPPQHSYDSHPDTLL